MYTNSKANSQKPFSTLCSLQCSYLGKSYLWKFGNDSCVNTNKSNVWCGMNETSENCLFNTASLLEPRSGSAFLTLPQITLVTPRFHLKKNNKKIPYLCRHSRTASQYGQSQSYEIKLPSQAFLDGKSSPRRKLRQVGCYDVAKFRLV